MLLPTDIHRCCYGTRACPRALCERHPVRLRTASAFAPPPPSHRTRFAVCVASWVTSNQKR